MKVNKPTTWVSSVVITTKKSGALRICLDPHPLIQVSHQEKNTPTANPRRLNTRAGTRLLTAGFWHCILDHESSVLTTFGRYRWRRLLFAFPTSIKIFQKEVGQALEGLNGILNITDHALIYSVGDAEDEALVDNDQKLEGLLQRWNTGRIALNKGKLKVCITEVLFIGLVFGNAALKIDPDKAIKWSQRCHRDCRDQTDLSTTWQSSCPD